MTGIPIVSVSPDAVLSVYRRSFFWMSLWTADSWRWEPVRTP